MMKHTPVPCDPRNTTAARMDRCRIVIVSLSAFLVTMSGSGCAGTGRQNAQVPPNPFFVMDTWFMAGESSPYASVESRLDLIRDLGYQGYACSLTERDELGNVLRMTEQKGLKPFAVYTSATLTREKLTFDPHLQPAMETLRKHGTAIWLIITSRDYEASSPEGDAVAVAGLRDLADSAGDIRVALYPHDRNWMERLQDSVRLADKVDRKNVGVTFNLCHCLKVGDEEAIPRLLEEAGPYLFMVTINGADSGAAGAGWDRLIQPLDRGTFDLRPLLGKLRDLDCTGPIGLQGYGVKGDVRGHLSRSMEAWRNLTAPNEEPAS